MPRQKMAAGFGGVALKLANLELLECSREEEGSMDYCGWRQGMEEARQGAEKCGTPAHHHPSCFLFHCMLSKIFFFFSPKYPHNPPYNLYVVS